MKIAFLNLYGGSVIRGAETFTQSFSIKLEKKHDVTWYKGYSIKSPLHQFTGNLLQRLKKRLFIDQANLEVLTFTLKQLKDIYKRNFDIVIPINGFWQVLLLKILQPFTHYKILITGHSGPGWDERFNLYLKPNIFIATTKPTLTWAKKTAPWTRSKLIPYGIDVDRFKNVNPVEINLRKPIILCPSALVPYKRIDLAIKATAKLESASLLVLGKGVLENDLEKMGKQLLGNRFQLKSVSYDRMPSYYKSADIVTLPSSPQENSPMVFLESLAANKLVVTTNTQRNHWMLGKAGIYCNPENLDDYTNALRRVLEKKNDQAAYGLIEKELKKFSWTSVASDYHDILNSLKIS